MKRTLALMLVLSISLSMAAASAQNLRSEHISSNGDYTVALQEDGTVKTIGNNDYGRCDTAAWQDIVAISAGHFHTLGLKSDGTVYATGRNTNGECDVDNWKDIMMVAAGWQSSFGLKKDGTIVYAGLTDAAEVAEIGEWENIVWIGTKIENSLFAIDKYGKVYGTGMDLSQLQNVVQVCDMFGCTLFLFADGTMKWLEVDSEGDEWIDIDYPGSKNVCEVTLLNTCYVALRKDGTVVSELDGADFSDWIDIVEIEGDIGIKSDGSTIVLDMWALDKWAYDYPPDQLYEISTWKVMVDPDTL
jgi:hypothetical protein